jgi:hypothetical protein
MQRKSSIWDRSLLKLYDWFEALRRSWMKSKPVIWFMFQSRISQNSFSLF